MVYINLIHSELSGLLFLIPIVGAIYGIPPNFRTKLASSEALRLDVMATVTPHNDMQQSWNLRIIKT